MSDKIRVIVVGVGKMGRNHLRVLRENPRFEVVGIVDPDESARALAQGRETWWSWAPPSGYDAAIVATPSETHVDVIKSDLHRNTKILVEKPLATSAEWATRVAERFGDRLVVGHIERFNPAVRALRDFLRRAQGRIEYVGTDRVGSPPAAPGTNIVLDLAVHDIDICQWLFGPLRLTASDCDPDNAEVAMRSERGVQFSTYVEWGGAQKIRTLEARGTFGHAIVDYQNQTFILNDAPQPVIRDEPLRAELDAFADFCETGERGDLCAAEDGAAVVRLAEMAINWPGYV